jgi:hypothetical protein
MKQGKNIVSVLLGSWLLFIAVDRVIGFLWPVRMEKKNGFSQFPIQIIFITRGIIVYFIAVLNFFLIANQIKKCNCKEGQV